ncbi:unnamed protein product [Heligmosomoides polygyrus]|uniref:Transposase n=1 Tax=Heligmosomoides polygyrus TaxID=6339 RepID=A0A183GNW4_HELPZ|nr:unnamed protein product [Heligmosomoides polygyrus]
MNGISGATARDGTTLIRGKLDDIPGTSIENSLKDFHGVRKKANWTVTSAVRRAALLQSRDRRTLLPALGHFLLSNNLIEKLCRPVSKAPALRLSQEMQRNSRIVKFNIREFRDVVVASLRSPLTIHQ